MKQGYKDALEELKVIRRLDDERELILFGYDALDLEEYGKGVHTSLIKEIEDRGITWDLIDPS
jgi:hypothetical protein